MKSLEFVDHVKFAASKPTLYVMGCIGAPLNAMNKLRYIQHSEFNQRPDRRTLIEQAEPDTFGFDCVCLIKAILWGWCADTFSAYGGAVYASNGVPDVDADTMFKQYTAHLGPWDTMIPGEMLWSPGHAGVYVGDGLAIECTPIWDDGVQVTNVGNLHMATRPDRPTRTWQGHGRLEWVDYSDQDKPTFCGYTDALPNAWYSEAVKWCTDNGIMTGTAPGVFGIGQALTREQAAVIAQRLYNLIVEDQPL